MRDRNISGIHRCSICNSVNIPDIETDLGDFRERMNFRPDPNDSMFDVCIECAEVIDDVLMEFEYEENYNEDL